MSSCNWSVVRGNDGGVKLIGVGRRASNDGHRCDGGNRAFLGFGMFAMFDGGRGYLYQVPLPLCCCCL